MIFNLTPTQDLPDRFTPVEAVAIIKCLDEDGDPALVLRTTEGLTGWEAVGMLTAALDTQRSDLREDFGED